MNCLENMFSVRKPVWRGLGTMVEEAPSSKDAIQLAGLDWNVVQSSCYTSKREKIDGVKLNIRDIDRQYLGVVSDKYKIVQNCEAFEFTDALLGEGVTYETAGSIASGRRVWLLARMPKQIIAEEDYEPYMVFSNNHDGTGSVKAAMTPIRVWCQNTLNLALGRAERTWSCRHRGDIQGKLDEARSTILNANKYLSSLNEELNGLKLIKIDDDKFVKTLDILLPEKETLSDRQKRNNADAKAEIQFRYFNAPDVQHLEKSAYRFVNAVTDYVDHANPTRRTKNYDENLFMKVIDGHKLVDLACKIAVA